MNATTIIVALIALGGPLVTFLVAARRFSGKIESSEATELWKESTAIREWSRGRIEALEKELRECAEGRAQDRERIAVLEAKIESLEDDGAPNGKS